MLFYRNKSSSPDCPVYKLPGVRDETLRQAICSNPKRQEIWKEPVSTLDRWLCKVDTHPTLHSSIITYLLQKDTTSFKDILDDTLQDLGLSQDKIV